MFLQRVKSLEEKLPKRQVEQSKPVSYEYKHAATGGTSEEYTIIFCIAR